MTEELWIGAGTLVITAVSLGAYMWFESRRRREKQTSNAARAQGGHAVAGSGNVVIGNVTVHATAPAPPPPSATPSLLRRVMGGPPGEEDPRKPPVEHHVKRDPHVCKEGPFKVTAGSFTKVELDVQAGDVVTGKLDGDADFDYDIVNERNYIVLRRGEQPSTADSGEMEPAYGIRWKVRGKGPWFLILSAPRRQYARSVYVYLRRG